MKRTFNNNEELAINLFIIMIIIIIAISVIIFVILRLVNNPKTKRQEEFQNKYYSGIRKNQGYQMYYAPYFMRKQVFTQNEQKFYIQLMHITQRYNVTVWSKVNLEQLISINNYVTSENEYNKIKNSIRGITADFVLLHSDTLMVLAVIEYMDPDQYKEQQLIEYKDHILRTAQIPMLRCESAINFEDTLKHILKLYKIKVK